MKIAKTKGQVRFSATHNGLVNRRGDMVVYDNQLTAYLTCIRGVGLEQLCKFLTCDAGILVDDLQVCGICKNIFTSDFHLVWNGSL